MLDIVDNLKSLKRSTGSSLNNKTNELDQIQLGTNAISFYCILMLINEGYKILDEGLINSEEEIDLLWIYGYAYPALKGGPLYTARNIFGLDNCLYALQKLQKQYPHRRLFQPAQFLIQSVQNQGAEGERNPKERKKVLQSKL